MPYREDLQGWMTVPDFKAIESLAATVPENGVVVEIGSAWGRSSWAWAKSVKPTVTVYCIDPWTKNDIYSATIDEFLESVKDCPNIIPIQGLSPDMKWDKKIKPDLVFIDGNHASPYVDNDISFWSKQLKPTGILSGHDFELEWFKDVCRATINQAMIMKKNLRIFEGSRIWYIELERNRLSRNNEDLIARLLLEDISYDVIELEKIASDFQIRSKFPPINVKS